MLFWLIVGFLVGLYLPAPYETVVRGWASSVWSWIRNLGS